MTLQVFKEADHLVLDGGCVDSLLSPEERVKAGHEYNAVTQGDACFVLKI